MIDIAETLQAQAESLMSKHTPGPWSRNIAEGGGSWIEHIDEDYVSHRVAFVYSDDAFEHTVTPRNHADANLIAAAPALLEALEQVALSPDESAYWMGTVERAIARAKGETE